MAARRLVVAAPVLPVRPCHPVERFELLGQGDAQARLRRGDLGFRGTDGAGQPFAERLLQHRRVRRRRRHRLGRRIGEAVPGLGKRAFDKEERPRIRADAGLHGWAGLEQVKQGPPRRLDLHRERKGLHAVLRQCGAHPRHGVVLVPHVFHLGGSTRGRQPSLQGHAPATLSDTAHHATARGGEAFRMFRSQEPEYGLPGRKVVNRGSGFPLIIHAQTVRAGADTRSRRLLTPSGADNETQRGQPKRSGAIYALLTAAQCLATTWRRGQRLLGQALRERDITRSPAAACGKGESSGGRRRSQNGVSHRRSVR